MGKIKVTEKARERSLEELAYGFFNQAQKIEDKDTEGARRLMALSWGMYRYLEKTEFMTMCTKYLQLLGVKKIDIYAYHNYGYDFALLSVNKLDERIEVE